MAGEPAAVDATAVASAGVPAAHFEVAHELTAADVEAWLNGFMTYGLKDGDIAGAVVAIVKDGKVLYQSGYGYADVERKLPMDADHVMTRIGSTSKLFTWTAVMQLVEQGKLDLNRNVDEYLDFKVSPPNGKPITLLDLMNHRGGFEEGLKDLLAFDPARAPSNEAYLKQHPRPLVFTAGSVPAYSNYGTALAGYIVQRVSGEPYERYIENHIFLPLGMRHSTFDQPLPAQFKGQVAQGYRAASLPAQPYELVVTRPAGSATTTAADMARFMLAHLQQGRVDDATILASDTAQLMHRPSTKGLPGFATLAHGFFHETRNGRTFIGHGGDTVFFHTELGLLPQEGVGLFVSFNSRGREDAVYGMRNAFVDQFMDRYFPATEPPLPAAKLASASADAQKIAGSYESSRRVEHGFLSVFYLLQQAVIGANGDGTIEAPKAFEGGTVRLEEIAPDLWREIGGTRQLALVTVDGVKTVVDSADPTSVLQAVPGYRSAGLNLTVLSVSALIAIGAVILWPVSALVRRRYQRPLALAPEARRWRLLLRVAALFGVLWLVGWMIILSPVLSAQLDFYSAALDPVIRTLQIAGVIIVVLAALGVWGFWKLLRADTWWLSRVGNGAIAVMLLGLVWIGVVGGLIGFEINY